MFILEQFLKSANSSRNLANLGPSLSERYIMNFVVIGRDHTDADALNRRLAVREAHLAGMEPLKAAGKVVYVAAMKNEEGNMNGSIIFFDVESKDEVTEYLRTEPYIQNNVWKSYEIQEVALPTTK